MLRKDLFIRVERKLESYDFKYEENKDDFMNNVKNNAIDTIKLFKDNIEIFKYEKIQSVSNYPKVDMKDTVAPCGFQVKCFVVKNNYSEDIHAIINAVDCEGQAIDQNAYQVDDGERKGRWLIHGNYNKNQKKDYAFAYSMGCIMFFQTAKLYDFNALLKLHGIKQDDIINAELIEK
ncbi:MAG: hypothetical protein JXB50_16855 [Spirochaetes bacterium]|nr:hypothetical protein [Spirochaetota bacterium]